MPDSISQAADAFAADMGGAPSGGQEAPKGAPESIFDNFNVDEGGQEGIPAAQDPQVKKAKRQEPAEEEPNSFGDDEEEEDLEEQESGDDEEDEDESSEGDDEEDEDEELMSREFTVMVDGEEQNISLREALDGGIRQRTFDQRMNKVAEATRIVQVEAGKVVEQKQQAAAMLAEAEEVMKSLIPDEPNWDELFASDPKAARDIQKQYETFNSKVQEIRAKREEAAKAAAKEAETATVEYAQQEYPKFAKAAKWKSQKDAQKDIQSMRRTALSVGFSEQEVASVLDSRMLQILLKASKYDRMMAAKPKAVNTKKAAVSPGAGSKRTASKGIVRAQKALSKTGSVEDAANVFSQII
jgi:hypothetical protein